MAARKRGAKKAPEFVEGTTTCRLIGHERDEETGERVIHEAGEDIKLPYRLGTRLAASNSPRFVTDPDERKEAKKDARAQKARLKAQAEEASAREAKRLELLGVGPSTARASSK